MSLEIKRSNFSPKWVLFRNLITIYIRLIGPYCHWASKHNILKLILPLIMCHRGTIYMLCGTLRFYHMSPYMRAPTHKLHHINCPKCTPLKSQNEKPLIWKSIGSFRARLYVRLCIFHLIFCLVSLSFNFELYIRLILDLFLVFSLLTNDL